LIGDRGDISYEVEDAFINAGVMHILAVSGLHVVIVVLIIFGLLIVFRVPEKYRIVLTCLFLVFYTFLTGQSPSVVRAVVMGIIMLGSQLFERNSNVYNSLALSAIVILFFDAKQLFNPGFILSFVAVFSLVALYPKLYSLKNYLPEKIKSITIVKLIYGTVAVSLASAIGTLPFTSFYVGKISVIGIIANLFIVPLSNVVLSIGMLTIAVSYASQWLAGIYAETTKLITYLLLESVRILGNFKYAYVNSYFTFWSASVFYLFIGFIFTLKLNAIWKRIIIVGLLTATVAIYYSPIFPDSKILRVTILDVGQGDGIFIEFPDGKNMLVDGGPKTSYRDAGERFISPFLMRKGLSKIDFVVNTQPDHDHLGGIPFLMRKYEIGKIIDVGLSDSSKIYQDYKHLIDSLRSQHSVVKKGDRIDGILNARIYILNPEGVSDLTNTTNMNNQSVVVKIVYGKTSLLLTGDAQLESENMMINRYRGFMHRDILKCGHHGSKTSTGAEFIKLVQPKNAIISVGYKNQFKHPSPEALRRLRTVGIHISRTDQQGAVIFESNGDKWEKIDWR
jgi:competence protein ComEC